MAKIKRQHQYVTGKTYLVVGASKRASMLRCVGKAKLNGKLFLMFIPTRERIKGIN